MQLVNRITRRGRRRSLPAQAAAPVYVGFGAVSTTGGAGGTLYTVTTLSDDATTPPSGSLREALEASGTRTIKFDSGIGGVIQLDDRLTISNGDVTIDGTDAASPGITLVGAGILIDASNVIIRNIRMRPTDQQAGEPLTSGGYPNPPQRDGLGIGYYGASSITRSNIIIDQCSLSFAMDENLSMYGSFSDVTIQNCIICSPINGNWNGSEQSPFNAVCAQPSPSEYVFGAPNNITFYGNYFAHGHERNPYFRGVNQTELINNYIHDYGVGSCQFADNMDALCIGNYFEKGYGADGTGGNTANQDHPVWTNILDDGVGPTVYFDDNKEYDIDGNAINHTNIYQNFGTTNGDANVTGTPPFTSTISNPMAHTAVKASVLANAGCRPDDRDGVDTWAVANATAYGVGNRDAKKWVDVPLWNQSTYVYSASIDDWETKSGVTFPPA